MWVGGAEDGVWVRVCVGRGHRGWGVGRGVWVGGTGDGVWVRVCVGRGRRGWGVGRGVCG